MQAVVAGLLLAGCVAPQPPMFGDGEAVPEEASRVALPVRPGPDGTWTLNAPAAGLLGQGRTLVRLAGPGNRRWRLTLPAGFALTAHRPGAAHSAFVRGHQVVLVGGGDGRRGPSAIARLDPERGLLTWQEALPPGSRVFLSEDGREVLTADCHRRSCDLTGRDAWSGALRWTHAVSGPVRVVEACGAGVPTSGDGRGGDGCEPYLVTPDRIGTIDPDDGGPHWLKALRPPDGTVDRVVKAADRVILVTAPAEGSCRATVLAGGTESGEGDRGWRYDFVWDQPQAARDPHTGCRWDRALPLTVGFPMVLPDAEGALLVNPYFGTRRPFQRLAPGEYLVTDGTANTIVRAPGRPDRLLSTSTGRLVRPHGLSPAARSLTQGFWQDGRRLLLLDHRGHALWRGTSDCQAFGHGSEGGPVTYCDGDDLVTLRPVRED
ncbi:PQQ-binding-like beta-propeller repeat protein [Streptomyces eurythermus]|uniref:outer membrane protein assembly factor BamB family protein n=1 Tax=Streptomyces eurythermus TaxID=42237 RepID=UPI0036F6A5B3